MLHGKRSVFRVQQFFQEVQPFHTRDAVQQQGQVTEALLLQSERIQADAHFSLKRA